MNGAPSYSQVFTVAGYRLWHAPAAVLLRSRETNSPSERSPHGLLRRRRRPPPAAPPAPPATSATASVPPAPPPPDPQLDFRMQYRDPGGMWMPSQMTLAQHVDTFAKMGVTLDPKALSSPTEAPLASVVYLGGCTGSFVSPDGLVVTNHHCVQGALQFNSKDGKNLRRGRLPREDEGRRAVGGPRAAT